MATLADVGDNVELAVLDKGEDVAIALSGTYTMTVLFQREVVQGGDAWETLRTFTTVDATVDETHVTEKFGENLRLIVTEDTSGSVTATLDNNVAERLDYLALRDRVGRLVQEWEQGNRLIHGGERHLSGGVVNVTAAALTVTAREHAGRIVTLNRAAGIACTMPAATGSGDVYTFFVGTTITSLTTVIQAASAADSFSGGVGIAGDIAGVTVLSLAADDTITLNGGTTGGIVGSWIKLTDVAAGKFMVEGFLVSTTAEADPFSAAV